MKDEEKDKNKNKNKNKDKIYYGIIDVKISDTRRMKEHSKYNYHEKASLSASKIPYSIETRT